MHSEISVAVFIHLVFDLDEVGVTLPHDIEDHPAAPNVSLAPLILLSVEVFKAYKGCTHRGQKRDIINVVPVFFAHLLEEDLIRALIIGQVQSDCISTALFIPAVEFSELLTPCLSLCIESSDRFSVERVLDLRVVVDLAVVFLFV